MARGGLLPPALLGAFSGLVVVVLLQSKTQERLFSTLQPGVVSRTPNSVTGEDGISTAFQSNFRSPAGASGEPADPPMESKTPAPREVKATFEAPSTSDEERRVLEVVKKRAGVYKDKEMHPEFSSVVLLTAANFAYFSIYNNWRCNAEKHGLDWAVIANDDKAFEELRPDRGLLAIGEKVSGMNGWGSAKLDSVGRNKMFMVLTIMRAADLGVVFTDADNMFLGDPFATGVHLGDLIRSGKYDYVYQEELAQAPAKGHVVPGDGGNTGFFYATPQNNKKMISFFADVVAEVDRQREEAFQRQGERLGADQPIFWQIMQKLRSTNGKIGPGGFKCVRLCKHNPTCKAQAEETLNYCSMNPFLHPTGWEEPPNGLVTYHANYAANEAKIEKLKKAGVWDAWSVEKQTCIGKEPKSQLLTVDADEERRVLEVVKKRAGVYKDKEMHPEFSSVVLLTAANFAYFSIYNNWRCNAEKHGLDWAVIANDDKAFEELGPDRGLLAIGEKVSGMNGWGSAKLDSVGRNKMFMVLTIMRAADLGVVFTDADNMFLGDPFATGVHLGDLIRSGKYDYVYQEELAQAPAKGHVVPGDGGNTGFFYATPQNNKKMISFFADVVAEVDRQREDAFRRYGERLGADQPIFWQIMQKLRSTNGKIGPGGFKCVELCGSKATCDASQEHTMRYCSMDAFMHPTGWETPPEERVTYHANYAANMDKIAKLKKAGVWDAWSEKTNQCKHSDRPTDGSATTSANIVTSASMTGTKAKVTAAIADAPVAKDMEPVLQCLRLTTPDIKTLTYPSDAEAHFEELQKVLSPWFDYAAKKFMADMKNPYHCGEGYCGPWIENRWIKRFLGGWENRSTSTHLSDLFGPFIPIFMTYVDLWVANVFEYESMIEALRKTVRPNVAYITVVQHDTGLVSSREKIVKIMKQIPNVLVLSAGGYGHVPIPLFKQPEGLLEKRFFKPMEKRELLTSYMGSDHNAPQDMRKKMIQTVNEEATLLGVKVRTGFGSADEWHQVAGNSKVSLCPRGYGRTAFHLFEILQLGLVPVHVYLDIPWVPYSDLYKTIGFSTDVKGLPELMSKINDMDLQDLERMEEKIRALRSTHFTNEGLLDQISLFMKNAGSDLRCQKVPATMNG